MKQIQRYTGGKYIAFLVVVLLALCISIGVSYGRYQLSVESDVELQNTISGTQPYLLCGDGGFQAPGEWVYDPDTESYTLPFQLSNACTSDSFPESDQESALTVVATVTDSDETQVMLTVGGDTYTARREPIIDGTVLWQRFGEGRVYRFYNEAGEELLWSLPGGRESRIPMTLNVKSSVPDTAFTLMAESSFGESETWTGVTKLQDTPGTYSQEETDWSALLVPGGQTILLGEVNGERDIPLAFPTEGLTVSVSDPKWVSAELRTTEQGQTVLHINSPLEQPKDTTENSESEEGSGKQTAAEEREEIVEGAEEVAGATEDSENQSELQQETASPQARSEALENETAPVSTTENGQAAEAAAGKTSEDVREMERRPDHVQVIVSWNHGEAAGKFDLASRGEEVTWGNLRADEALKFYHPKGPVALQADDTLHTKILWNETTFPSMTRYSVNGENYLLYDQDALYLAPGTTALLDLSLIDDCPKKLTLTGGETKLDLSYYALQDYSEDTQPIIMGDSGLLVSMLWNWGAVAPEIEIERLEMVETEETEEKELDWVRDESIQCMEHPFTGEVQMTPDRTTPAGTYWVTMVWKDDLTEYIRLEFPFYVIYESGILRQPEISLYRYVGSGTQTLLETGQELEVEVTYYCGCAECCGEADYVTASGKTVARGMVAMSEEYPFGAQIVIDGIVYSVEDRGDAITGNRVDIYVPNHEEATRMGRNTVQAVVYMAETPVQENDG